MLPEGDPEQDQFAWLVDAVERDLTSLTRMAYAILGNAYDAGDAVGNVLESMVKAAGAGRRPNTAPAYLRAAVRNECKRISLTRGKGGLPADLQWLEGLVIRDVPGGGLTDALALKEGIMDLPRSEARAFYCIHVLGFTYEEAALILETAPATLHGQVKRAESRLRATFSEAPNEGTS